MGRAWKSPSSVLSVAEALRSSEASVLTCYCTQVSSGFILHTKAGTVCTRAHCEGRFVDEIGAERIHKLTDLLTHSYFLVKLCIGKVKLN